MMHSRRRWCLAEVESAAALAQMLVERTWTLCSAFTVTGHPRYLFLNDATHEDGAAEFAILKHLPDGTYLQVESVTFSWCSVPRALEQIENALAGKDDGPVFLRPVKPAIDSRERHGRCPLCA